MSRFSGLFNIQPPQYKPSDDGGYDSGMAGDMFSGAMNVLDLPGSMVRDAVSFSNPFDQLVTPFSDKNRTTGAQISRYWAGGDEDSAGNQLAGLVIDVLTDPMMLATGGTAAVGRAGLAGGKAALRGLKGVGKAASGAYDTAKAGSLQSRALKSADRMLDNADALDARAAAHLKGLTDTIGPRPTWDPDFVGPHKGIVPREAYFDSDGTTRAMKEMFPDMDKQKFNMFTRFAEARKAREDAADRVARVASLANRPMIRATEGAQAIGSAAREGAQQLRQAVPEGIRSGVRTAYDAGRGMLGRAVTGNRNAMFQTGAIGGNIAQTATGQRMSQEPTLEDMIAQALTEDPQLMEELLMAMGAGEAGY